MIRKFVWLASVMLLIAAPSMAWGQGGTVTGTVVDATTLQPLPAAQIQIAGTTLGTIANDQGRFIILNVPPGQREVRASLIGYAMGTQTVNVAAGSTATASFSLQQSAVQIEGLIVTATGNEQRRREIGNSVATVRTEDLELAPIKSVSEMLQGRAAGVIVQPTSGTTGTGSRIRIRGASSVSLDGTPLLIVDGIRVSNDSEDSGLFTGGIETSRWNDLNPEDIESIEILKGPAASALYGTAAANGVIQITTKRGRPGRTQIRAYAETSNLSIPDENVPTNYLSLGFRSDLNRVGECSLVERARGFCANPETTYEYNPLLQAENSPLREGGQQRYGVNFSGGSEEGQITYYFAAENQDGTGLTRYNELERQNFRANVSGAVNDRLRIGANSNFVTSYTQLPQEGNTGNGSWVLAGTGDPSPENVTRGQGFRSPYTAANVGWWRNEEELRRFVGSVTADWTPFSWLQVNGVAGIDQANRFEQSTIPVPGLATGFFRDGLREQYRTQSREITTNLNANSTYGITEALTGTTSLGLQYNEERNDWTYGAGRGLAPGTLTTGQALSVQEFFGETKLFGVYGSQQLALNDRLFLTGAIRGDQNSAFGENIGFVVYPALSASWVVLEEPWFPENDYLSTLRLRAAYGESGQRPGRLDAVRTYETQAVALGGGITSGFVVDNAGNPDLEAEISREYEFGADFGFLNDRVALQVTRFDRNTNNALVARPLPPSVGGPSSQFFNLGEVENAGWEAAIQLEPVRRQNLNINLGVNIATNENKLVELGDTLIPPITFGLQRHTDGYPLGGYWAEKYEFSDANNNGLIEWDEVTALETQDDPDTDSSYLGQPFPAHEVAFTGNIGFLEFFQLSGLLEYKGGHKIMNYTSRIRCAEPSRSFCDVRHVPGAGTLEEQARIIARRKIGTSAGFVEDADFWKLRELSLSFNAPRSLLDRTGFTQSLQLTLSGRNLGLWTDYTGLDPEANIPGAVGTSADPGRFFTGDYFNVPAPRTLILRVDVGL